MVNNCCVCGCTNYVNKKDGLRFFRFPLSDKERWAAAVRRANWQPMKYTRICGEHFVKGEPNHDDPDDKDYIPSVMPSCYGSKTIPKAQKQADSRHQRLLQRRENEQQRLLAQEAAHKAEREKQRLANEKTERERLEAAAILMEFSQQEFIKDQSTQTESPTTKDATTSTYGTQSEESVAQVLKENQDLKKKVLSSTFRAAMIEGDDSLTHQYTGLPTWGVFLHLVMFLIPFANTTLRTTALTAEDEIFLTLVRLRLALFLDDLANRFDISPSNVSRIFQKWLNIMHSKLGFLITWPSRGIICQNMPPAFKALYPKCCCIIDCSEVFIEMPSSFSARSQTYSDYKKHNTFKFLIGITPCGSICFLSKCWVSDKQLTQESNFFSYLEHGDVVLADRGFTISEDLAVHGAKLEIPAFTRGKSQLTQREVETSKQLSMVRIHVERVIGLLKNKYTLLKGPIPVNLLKHKGDKDIANIDKILVVYSALTNLHKVVV